MLQGREVENDDRNRLEYLHTLRKHKYKRYNFCECKAKLFSKIRLCKSFNNSIPPFSFHIPLPENNICKHARFPYRISGFNLSYLIN